MISRHALLILAMLLPACTASSAGQSPPTSDDDPEHHEETTTNTETDEEQRQPSTYEGVADERAPYDRHYDASELFDAVCAGCHGVDGDGDAPIDDAFSFATPADEWTHSPTVDGILMTLDDGVHDTAMREFPEYKDLDRQLLAEYVLELRHALQLEQEQQQQDQQDQQEK